MVIDCASELHTLSMICKLFAQPKMMLYSCFQNDTLQNNNGCGSSAFDSAQFADANGPLLDSSSKEDRASDILLGFSIYTMGSEIIEHAFRGMDELAKIGIAEQPLWQRQPQNSSCEILNDTEYLKQFGEVDTTLSEIVKLMEVGESQNLPSFDTYQTEHPITTTLTPTVTSHSEGSRAMAYITMAPICIVELLMDVVSYFFFPFPFSLIQFRISLYFFSGHLHSLVMMI